MVINKNNIWIPVIIIIFSFISEILSNKVSFFTSKLSNLTFWTGISVAGLLISLELVAILQKFINENFQTPINKAKEHQKVINQEREQIKKLLVFDTENKTTAIKNIKTEAYCSKSLPFFLYV